MDNNCKIITFVNMGGFQKSIVRRIQWRRKWERFASERE